ncbi:MAG: hypothetical protein GY930_17720 [bacterium]|nr:hypothetical protein [bacterium]
MQNPPSPGQPTRKGHSSSGLGLVLALVLPACLIAPPAAQVFSASGTVRGASTSEAQELADKLEYLRPSLMRSLPGVRQVDDLEVWIQDTPGLYSFPHSSNSDAEGLWSESHDRILLARNADDMERTLAHELVHASLGHGWHTLPGTLEEGLADYMSAKLVPDAAARLRAGRLASAALATGGLGMTLSIRLPNNPSTWMARITLSGTQPSANPQRDVFRLAAGLSSTKVTAASKRGYYGLAFVLINRTIERQGLQHLLNLCLSAEQQGYESVPRPWLLKAADLADTPEAWRTAALEAMGKAELVELLDMHPGFVRNAAANYLRDKGIQDLEGLEITLTLRESNTTLDLQENEAFTTALLAELTE